MLQYQAGAARAFEILYARHKSGLYRYFLRQCRVAAVAEELYQDVWTNLIRARSRYQPSAKFTTYLYRLAHNRLVDYYRRGRTGVLLSYDNDPDETPLVERVADIPEREPENELEQRRRAKRLQELLGTLPEAQREAFLLREEGGLSLAEMAATMGVNMETAKSRLRYAVAKLRAQLEDPRSMRRDKED